MDITDLGILATNWQQSPRVFSQGDLNHDSMVDITDLGMLATNWQASLPAPAIRQSRAPSGTVRRALLSDRRNLQRTRLIEAIDSLVA